MVAKGRATHEDVVQRSLKFFENKFRRFMGNVHWVPLMLSVALLPSSPTQGLGADLWRKAQGKVVGVSLEDLLSKRARDQAAAESGELVLKDTQSEVCSRPVVVCMRSRQWIPKP